MARTVYAAALTIVVAGAYLRGAGVVLAFVRTFLERKRFVTFRMGWVEIACTFEPPLLFAVTYALQSRSAVLVDPSAAQLATAVTGALVMLAAWDLLAWAFLSWRALFAGHGILAGHQLATQGAYGFVRHPVYLAAFLVWLALAIAFRSTGTLVITALFVIPVYLLYMRSEEEMMTETFGDAYRDYRRRVPMLVPRLGRAARVGELSQRTERS